MRYYEYRHQVGLEETSIVGNVYFAHYVRWQGHCREAFLREHAPEVLREMGNSLALATTRVCCSYHRELGNLDEVVIRMHAAHMTSSRLTISFSYFRIGPENLEELVADGEQEVVCMRRIEGRMIMAPLPRALCDAVNDFIRPLGEAVTT